MTPTATRSSTATTTVPAPTRAPVAAGPGWADGAAAPSPTAKDDVRGETPARRVLVPGGVLLVYGLDRRDPPPTGAVYRGPEGKPSSVPLLPPVR